MPGTAGDKRRDWTRAELLKALSLYCQIPFGQFDAMNLHVKALAGEIGRTPGSVSFKLSNLASLDPYHAARGIRGMAHASRGDRAIWDEFYGRWDALAEAMPESLAPTPAPTPAPTIANAAMPTAVESTGESAVPDASRPGRAPAVTETIRATKVRLGQAFFRNAVLSAWDGRCALTDISEPALLRASHIRPWSSHRGGRLDPCNGLCLNALHDAAFDRGLITFTDRLELLLSPRLRESVPPDVFAEMFAKRDGKPLRTPGRFGPSAESMAWHRREVFCG